MLYLLFFNKDTETVFYRTVYYHTKHYTRTKVYRTKEDGGVFWSGAPFYTKQYLDFVEARSLDSILEVVTDTSYSYRFILVRAGNVLDSQIMNRSDKSVRFVNSDRPFWANYAIVPFLQHRGFAHYREYKLYEIEK